MSTKALSPLPSSPFNRNVKWAKRGDYTTKLGPEEESQFQMWVRQNNIPFDPSPTADYDMRGFWKAQQQGDPRAQRASNLHFPDVWKTPYHKSFSRESKYALPSAPQWKGNQLVDSSTGTVVYQEPSSPQ